MANQKMKRAFVSAIDVPDKSTIRVSCQAGRFAKRWLTHTWVHLNLFLPVLLTLILSACVSGMDPDKVYKVSEGYMIDEYIAQNPNLGLCSELIAKSSFNGMLHGYGSYTFFAPTDEALSAYLTSIGRSSVNELTTEEADAIIRYHVIRDSIKTTDLVDGRLPSPTISGKFLTSRVETDASDNAWYVLNRQSKIVENDISCDNGIVQVVDALLTPPTKTVMQQLAALPDSFSVCKHLVLKYSRFSPDSLSQAAQDTSWLSLFVQNNQSYVELGVGITNEMIASGEYSTIEEKLLTKLRKNQPSVTSDRVLLNQYADYHLIPSLKYVSDLLYTSSIETAVTNQVLSFKLLGEKFMVNYFEMGSTIEPGVELNRSSNYTDLSCSNGVIHQIAGQIEIKNRAAYRVYWDMAVVEVRVVALDRVDLGHPPREGLCHVGCSCRYPLA